MRPSLSIVVASSLLRPIKSEFRDMRAVWKQLTAISLSLVLADDLTEAHCEIPKRLQSHIAIMIDTILGFCCCCSCYFSPLFSSLRSVSVYSIRFYDRRWWWSDDRWSKCHGTTECKTIILAGMNMRPNESRHRLRSSDKHKNASGMGLPFAAAPHLITICYVFPPWLWTWTDININRSSFFCCWFAAIARRLGS